MMIILKFILKFDQNSGNLQKFWVYFLLIGSRVGQRITDHPDIRKVGFTGSTQIGAGIMKRFALNIFGIKSISLIKLRITSAVI